MTGALRRAGGLRGGGLAAGIFILIALPLFLYPILNLVNVSLKTSAEFMKDPVGLTRSLHFSNYAQIFVKGKFIRYFLNSVLYLAAANLLTLSITALAAFVISRRYVRFSGFFYLLFLTGIFLPDPLIPQFYLLLNLGLYNHPLGYILLKASPGILMLLMVGYYKTIPREFDEAAAMDGCGSLRYIARFILPLSRPVFASGAILFSLGVWNDIIGTTIFLTSPRYYPVIRSLFAYVGQYGTNWPPLAAAVFIVGAPLILLFVFFQRFIISGIVSGGVKG
jgi:raffinose/stachyose/melibiose transport system permease protein